jgi:beta-N-acetylhexosaminidase
LTDFLRLAPFLLDDEALAWVETTRDGLSLDEQVGQLFNFMSRGTGPEEAERLRALQPGGITRMFGPDFETEANLMDQIRAEAGIPLLLSADLEGSLMSLRFGTEVPNPLALAAVDDVAATSAIATIIAEEGAALGINWSFTPVIDINTNWRSPIVATRGFGADVDRIERHALATIKAFQAAGVAATVKHWPGDGEDDRDQHLVTTINPLSIEDWEATHGRLYRAAIAGGVDSVMSAHIAFPAFVRALDPNATTEAYRPAAVSRVLNIDLLRDRLGFNGLIVSDATSMGGFGAFASRRDMLPEVIENGCDMILFSPDPDADIALIRAAVRDGRISKGRLRDALTRILGMKAARGLHRQPFTPALSQRARVGRTESRAVAEAVFARTPTLIKDTTGLLPLNPARHRRVLLVTGGVVTPFMPPQPLALTALLAAEGFEVELHEPGKMIDPAAHDLVLFALAEETLLLRGRIFLDWHRLMGGIDVVMQRVWHDVPTILISFGFPYMLYDAPRVPTAINAYGSSPAMQKAVLDCLLGRVSFNSSSPIDPFCGLEDAHW